MENYYQEAGRAGRDGADAVCTLLYQPKDISTQRWLLDQNYPSLSQVINVYKGVKALGGKPVRATEIAGGTRLSDTALNSALVLLKEQNLVGITADGEYFDRALSEPASSVNMSSMRERRLRDEARLDSIVSYARGSRCRRAFILSYFGQELSSECTGCDVCQPSIVPAVMPTAIPPAGGRSAAPGAAGGQAAGRGAMTILEAVNLLNGLVGRTTVAAVLTGSKSKKVTEANLHRSSLYGSLSGRSQDSVVKDIDELIDQGHIVSVGDYYPKVKLSASGRALLSGRG
jgi:ATP-dependent DNA helicase RecQ